MQQSLQTEIGITLQHWGLSTVHGGLLIVFYIAQFCYRNLVLLKLNVLIFVPNSFIQLQLHSLRAKHGFTDILRSGNPGTLA